MYTQWSEIQSYGQQRLQQFIAQADEWRLPPSAPPRSRGSGQRGPRAVAQARLALTHA